MEISTTTSRRQRRRLFCCGKKSSSTTFLFGLVIGNICMLTIMNMIIWYNHHPVDVDGNNIMKIPNPQSSSSSLTTNTNNGIFENDVFTQIQCNHILNGTRILLVEVHLEGNLGDELETTPLLYFLKVKCQMHITAVLSSWLETPSEQLSYKSIRSHQYIDVIKSPTENFMLKLNTNNYDAVLLSPGPWRLCHIAKNWYPHHIDIFVGGSIIINDDDDDDCNLDFKRRMGGGGEGIDFKNSSSSSSISNIDMYMKELSVKLILARETYTYNMLVRYQQSTTTKVKTSSHKTFLSGDLTNSIFPSSLLHRPSIEYWKSVYTANYKNSILIFSRSSNIDNVVEIVDMTVRLKTFQYNDNDENRKSETTGIVTITKNFVFATSSELEDSDKFNEWKHKYHNRFQPDQYVICQSMEQLIALVGLAKHIYTDRYHPGVVAHMLGKQFTILEYRKEQSKLIGLSQLVNEEEKDMANNNISTISNIMNVPQTRLRKYNAKAMELIVETIRDLKEKRRKTGTA